MKMKYILSAMLLACLACGCASVGHPAAARVIDRADEQARLAIPKSMVDDKSTPVQWSYSVRTDRRVAISLNGVTVYRNWLYAFDWAHPEYFTSTRLAPGDYTIVVEDLKTGKSTEANLRVTGGEASVWLEFDDAPVIRPNPESYWRHI